MLQRFPKWLFLGIAGGWALYMLVELLLTTSGGSHQLDRASALAIVSSLSRSHNQLVSIVMVSIALAVPMTATHYTPKLLRLFVTDRLHLAVLSFYALAAVHANWVMFLLRDALPPPWLVNVVVFTGSVGFIAMVPYFFYVIWFLEPSTLVRRIRAQGLRAADLVLSPATDAMAKQGLFSSLRNLGSVVLKSIDNSGRQTAEDGIHAIRELVAYYGLNKTKIRPEWFEVSKRDFRGMSREALRFISGDHCWAEVVALQDLNLAFESAITRMPDAVVSVADAVRGIAVDAHKRNDPAAILNAVRTFNSMLRSSLRRNEPHAIFDVLNQYRALAEDCLNARPEVACEIADHFAYYGRIARQKNLDFIPELFLYDLGHLLDFSIEVKSPTTDEILERFLGLSASLAQKPTVPLACAALVTAGTVSDLLTPEQTDRLLTVIEDLPRELVELGVAVIDATEQPRYRELTARQVDLNFVPPQRMMQLEAELADRALERESGTAS